MTILASEEIEIWCQKHWASTNLNRQLDYGDRNHNPVLLNLKIYNFKKKKTHKPRKRNSLTLPLFVDLFTQRYLHARTFFLLSQNLLFVFISSVYTLNEALWSFHFLIRPIFSHKIVSTQLYYIFDILKDNHMNIYKSIQQIPSTIDIQKCVSLCVLSFCNIKWITHSVSPNNALICNKVILFLIFVFL